MCLLDDACVCLTYNKNARECKLYDNEYSADLEAFTGTNFYSRSDQCC